jgi:RNA polymerase sigma factor (sigma-70 family)
MKSDGEILRQYVEKHSSDAFADLVHRHVNLVYSAALRQVNGDAHLAQDVTQSVFVDLANKAVSLRNRVSITGWLYTSAHYAAAKAVRSESRRRAREQEANRMQELINSDAEVDWEAVGPVLDEVMHQLREGDREVILLRYFEDRPFAEIGASLGVSENAARMRVERALEKLRDLLSGREVTASATVLAITLASQSVKAAPVGLAKAVIGSSLAQAAAGGKGIGTIIGKVMSMSKLKVGVSALIGIGLITGLVQQHRSIARLTGENAALLAKEEQLAASRGQKAQKEASANASGNGAEIDQLRQEHHELIRLRGEVTRLQATVNASSNRVSNVKDAYGLLPEEMPVIRSSSPAHDAWAYGQLVKKLSSGQITPAEEYHLAKAWPYLGKRFGEPDQFGVFQSSYVASVLDISDKDIIWQMRKILEQARDEEHAKGLRWVRAYDDGLMGGSAPLQNAGKAEETRQRWQALDQATLQRLSDLLPRDKQQQLAANFTSVLDIDARLKSNTQRLPNDAKFEGLTPEQIQSSWPYPQGTSLQTVVKRTSE